jgi:hypothetical protein
MKDLKPQGTRAQPAGSTPGGSPPANSNPTRPTGLTTEIQARIGHQLRAMYDEVVRQGVPDRFAVIIRKLDDPSANPDGGVKEEGSE